MQFEIFDLGLVDFKKAWDFQKQAFEAVRNNYFVAALILCQHYPVITLGRSADRKNILASETTLNRQGIKVFEIERGGDVTYHGPGQITVYPVFNLEYLRKDIHWFLRQLEEVAIDLLSDFGIEGKRVAGLTGVWVDNQKIASIGIAVRNWITFHGLTINIKKSDLRNFGLIRPCGLDIEMISLEEISGKEIEMIAVKERLIKKLKSAFLAPQESLAAIN